MQALHEKICTLSHEKESSKPTHDESLTTMIHLKDLKTCLINQSVATVKGNYGKSTELLGKKKTNKQTNEFQNKRLSRNQGTIAVIFRNSYRRTI